MGLGGGREKDVTSLAPANLASATQGSLSALYCIYTSLQ